MVLVVLLAGLPVAGCGSDDDPDPSAARLSTTPTPTVTVTGPVDGSAPLTGGGATLRLGGGAVVAYRALAFTSDATTLEVRVTGVDRGDLNDLRAEGVRVDDSVNGHVPWYVRTEFVNRGPGDITDGGINLDTGIMVVDSAGAAVKPAVFTGAGRFNRCERDGIQPLPWRPGRTSTACTVFLLPAGEEPGGVTFPVDRGKSDSTERGDRVTWQR